MQIPAHTKRNQLKRAEHRQRRWMQATPAETELNPTQSKRARRRAWPMGRGGLCGGEGGGVVDTCPN